MIELMRFERTPCFGTCPVYQVTLDQDGLVTWSGEIFVRSVGIRQWKISQQKMKALEEALLAADFFTIDRQEGIGHYMTDCPGCNLSVTLADGRQRTITHDHGDTSWPEQLDELEKTIDRILGTAKHVKTPRNPVDPQSVEPTAFQASIGCCMNNDGYSVEWEDGMLIYRPWGYEPEIRVQPLPEDWQRFWAEMDKIGVWDWEKHYDNMWVLDGTSWSIKLKQGKKRVTSDGSNAYPGSEGPETSATFRAFCRAVQKLLGGFEFK